jgi:hypothetical protein
MAQVTYEVVEHDGGWAYKVEDVFSETFATHDEARRAADAAARRQQLGGESRVIEYEDAGGQWHTEVAGGGDRPETSVEDDTDPRHRGGGPARDIDPASLAREAAGEVPESERRERREKRH